MRLVPHLQAPEPGPGAVFSVQLTSPALSQPCSPPLFMGRSWNLPRGGKTALRWPPPLAQAGVCHTPGIAFSEISSRSGHPGLSTAWLMRPTQVWKQTFFATLRRPRAQTPISIKLGQHGACGSRRKTNRELNFLKIFCLSRQRSRGSREITFTDDFRKEPFASAGACFEDVPTGPCLFPTSYSHLIAGGV